MNEKIKELAEQAKLDIFFLKGKKVACALDQKSELPTFNDDEMFIQKFAELLIQECAEVCRREHWSILDSELESNEDFVRGVKTGRKTASIELYEKILKVMND